MFIRKYSKFIITLNNITLDVISFYLDHVIICLALLYKHYVTYFLQERYLYNLVELPI